MAMEKYYWDTIRNIANGVAEEIRDAHPQARFLSDSIHEHSDQTEWSIYTHKANKTMSYTDNPDALFEWEFSLSDKKSWSEVVCLAAACALTQDVTDYYHRNYNEDGSPKGEDK